MDKHGIEYTNERHGNFENVNEVIATCKKLKGCLLFRTNLDFTLPIPGLKVSPDMEHFSEDKVTIKTNAKFMEDIAVELHMRNNYQEPVEATSSETSCGFVPYFQGQ
jgi:hypothetical protein